MKNKTLYIAFGIIIQYKVSVWQFSRTWQVKFKIFEYAFKNRLIVNLNYSNNFKTCREHKYFPVRVANKKKKTLWNTVQLLKIFKLISIYWIQTIFTICFWAKRSKLQSNKKLYSELYKRSISLYKTYM